MRHGSQSAQKYFSLPCAHLFLFFPMLASPFRAPPSAAKAPSPLVWSSLLFRPVRAGKVAFSRGRVRRDAWFSVARANEATRASPPHTLELLFHRHRESTDVASFIAANVSPVDGDLSSELSGPTEKTRRLWSACQDACA